MLNGALIGAGNIARAGHLPAYLGADTVRARLRIVAAADPCPQNLDALAAALPGVRCYSDPHALLAAEQLDFVDVCTPPYAHAELIGLAAEAGCHVLCEKPLSVDLDEALAIRARIRGRGLVVMPCHQYHHAPQWRAVREAVRAGEAGRVRLGLLTVQRVGANAGNPTWNPAWRTDPAIAGGGILVDHGTHLFYQLHSLFGEPAEIACSLERRLADCPVDDTATLYLRYPHLLVRLHLTWAAQSRYSSHRYIGTRGEVALLDDAVVVRGEDGERRVPFTAGLSKGSAHAEWFEPLLLEFAGRIERRDDRLDRFDEAVAVAACLSRAYESAAHGGRPLGWTDPLTATSTAPASAYAAAG